MVRWWMIFNLMFMLSLAFVGDGERTPIKAVAVAATAALIGVPVALWIFMVEER